MRRGNVSHRRNPLIAELLGRIDMGEAWGRGMLLILENAPDVAFREIARLFVASFERPSATVETIPVTNLDSPENAKKTPRKRQENAKKTPRKRQENAKKTPKKLPKKLPKNPNMNKPASAKQQELVAKLREVFQIDRPELNFGIYLQKLAERIC